MPRKVIVIGAGPAGMMAAAQSAKKGNQVTLLEKTKSPGNKLLLTGKGRCNLTNSMDIKEFVGNIPGNGCFLYSAFSQFSNKDLIEFFRELGVETKEERGGRIFPVSDKSEDVLAALKRYMARVGVKLVTGS